MVFMIGIAIVGHIDHGKSTLIGRLLYDTHSIPSEKLREIETVCRGLNKSTEFAYIVDALEEERRSEMTIETTQTFFKHKNKEFALIDAPGHKEFLKNMITGTSQAHAAILVIDAEKGVEEQTKRHAYILKLLGIESIIVAINKMDLINYSKKIFDSVKQRIEEYFHMIGIRPMLIIPVSAYFGDNIAVKSKKMPWNKHTLLDALSYLEKTRHTNLFCFVVQDMFNNLYSGNLISGEIRSGEKVRRYPKGDSIIIEKIFEEKEVDKISAPKAIGIKCNKMLKRGDVLMKNKKPLVTNKLISPLFVLKNEIMENKTFVLRCFTQESKCSLKIIEKINIESMEKEKSDILKESDIGKVKIFLKKALVFQKFSHMKELGRFVLTKNNEIVAGGIVT